MTYSTHLPSPTPDELAALIDAAGLSAAEAGKLIGVTARAIQLARAGTHPMRGNAWELLKIKLSRRARAALPAPVVD